MSYTNQQQRRKPKKYQIWEQDKATAQLILNEIVATYESQLNAILAACNVFVKRREAEAEAAIDEVWKRAKNEIRETRQHLAQKICAMRREVQAAKKREAAWKKQVEILAEENLSLLDELSRLQTGLDAKQRILPRKDIKRAGGKNKPLTNNRPKHRPNQRYED